MGTPFIVARQPSQSPLSLTGICYEVSDKLGLVETTVSTGEPQNELSVLLRRWRVCLLQQILHHSEQMNSLDGNTIGGRNKMEDRTVGGSAPSLRTTIPFSRRDIFTSQLIIAIQRFLSGPLLP